VSEASTVAALESVISKYERGAIAVELQGLDHTRLDMPDRVAGHVAGNHQPVTPGEQVNAVDR